MYNRYVPQPDGSYHRKRMQDARPAPQPAPRQQRPEKREDEKTRKEPPKPSEPAQEPKNEQKRSPDHAPAGSFLKNLLPADFDTGDLLIVLLLLIIAGDSEDGQNSALLTLALYLFM